jgi:hypothetical protein
MSDIKQEPQKPQQINIELGEKEAEGIYSNLAIISHSAAEFVIDFTRILPGVPKAKVHARIIMTPQHAKMLMNALKDNISKFEMQFGEITPDKNRGLFPGFDEPPKVN